MVPLAENTALGIAIMSYDGQLNFGLLADRDALDDVDVLATSCWPRSPSSRTRPARWRCAARRRRNRIHAVR